MEQKIVRSNIADHYFFYNMTFKPSQQFMLIEVEQIVTDVVRKSIEEFDK